MAARRPKRLRRVLPGICLDEHVPPAVAFVFQQTFRVFQAARNRRWKGRDEWDYINELYRENAVFVTSDHAHARKFRSGRWQHAGLIYMPNQWSESDKVTFATIITGFIQGYCAGSRFALRNHLVYDAPDGLRLVLAGKERLYISWERLGHLADEKAPDRSKRARGRRR